ncbi:MAG: CNNM domain-containing protein [Candidatus Omnitrophota bacterium]
MMALYILGSFVLLLLQGFFAASEISFISSVMLTLRHRQEKGDKRAKKVYSLMSKPEKFLATTLVGTNISVVLSSSLMTLFFISLGIGNSNIWVTVIFTPLVVVFAELIPKNIGKYFREDFSCRVVNIIDFFQRIFSPAVTGILGVSNFIVGLVVGHSRKRSPFVTKEEIKFLLKEIQKQGGIDRGEQEAIEEVFEFKSSKIKDVCVSLNKVAGFDYTDSFERIVEIARGSRFTRFVVFKNREVVGYVNIFDIFYNPGKNWHYLIRPIPKVGANQKLYEVFTRLKSDKESIALVLKGRRPSGIITLQDLIREVITSIVKI